MTQTPLSYQDHTNTVLAVVDWLGQLGHLDLPIISIYNRVNSATSTISFTPEMMIQHFQEGLGLCNHTMMPVPICKTFIQCQDTTPDISQ
ncbi:hypothetical protein ACTXT7_015745 [Hymenolepis weldensis]